MKIVSSYAFRKYSSAEAVEASFKIAFLIALAKKPHNIEKTLIKSCMLKEASLVLGRQTEKSWHIFFSLTTVKTRIDIIAEDTNFQVLEKINNSCAFAVQCNEATDIDEMPQLLAYICFVGSTSIEVEMLFCKLLKKTTKGKDVFEAVSFYVEHN